MYSLLAGALPGHLDPMSSSLIWTGNVWQAVQFYFKFPNEIFYVKQPQRLHFSSCAVEGRVWGFPAELHQQLGLNIVQMFTSHRVWKCPLTSAVVPVADQNLSITLWNISTCTWWAVCSYFMVNGMSHACSCVAARLKYKMSREKWIVVFPSLICQHRHQSFQNSWTVTFPWPQPLYLQITMVC